MRTMFQTRISKRCTAFVAVLSAIAISSPAQAIWCRGPVTDVKINQMPGGGQAYDLQISWGWGAIAVCNMEQNFTYDNTTYSPEACQRIYSQAMTALGIGGDLSVNFPGIAADCSTFLSNAQPPQHAANWFRVIAPTSP